MVEELVDDDDVLPGQFERQVAVARLEPHQRVDAAFPRGDGGMAHQRGIEVDAGELHGDAVRIQLRGKVDLHAAGAAADAEHAHSCMRAGRTAPDVVEVEPFR